uniref:Uncharacterized protein n=1 Tax=Biomphalaria glabrata TaxID=6526 RepID=A0A2C9KDR0_BIOGL
MVDKVYQVYPGSGRVLVFSMCQSCLQVTSVKIVDLTPKGEVKAAGVVCLIGLGLSLGTLLLYKLYFRIIVPFLNSVWDTKGRNSLIDDEYTLYLESSDSEVDTMGGNSHSKKSIPSVYYSPGYGVSLGSRPPTLDVDLGDLKEGIRLRPRKSHRQKSPSPASDKDSAIGGVVGSEMSQSMYSENSTNRDSFYSTAESGYDEFGYLDDYRSASKLSSSLKENHSPSSLKERNLNMLYRAHHGYDAGLNSIGHSMKPGLDTLSDCSSERSGIVSSRSYQSSAGSSSRDVTVRTNVDPLVEKYAAELSGRTGSRLSQNSQDKSSYSLPNNKVLSPIENTGVLSPHSDSTSYSPKIVSTESSPCHRKNLQRFGKGGSPFRSLHHTRPQHGPNSEDWDYDPSLDASESIQSFSSNDIDWDNDLDSRERMSILPELPDSNDPDEEFKKSLIHRIQQWSDFADEYQKSRSPTPDVPQMKFIRRSRSLDRHLGDPSSVLISEAAQIVAAAKTTVIEPTTEKNLESLEYELHDIQGEFESITSKLHELIENVQQPTSSKPHASDGPHRVQSRPKPIDSKMRTRWEHVPSSVCSDSEGRSSRASSVEYAWDLAEYSHNRQRSDSCVSKEMNIDVAMGGFTEDVSIMNIFEPVVIADYAEEQWKGNTDKAKTVKEGYSKIPRLLSCHRMCVIRGDNYCALRSVLFQVLANGQRVTQHWSGIIGIMDSLHKMHGDPTVALSNWTFANRLPDHCEDKLGSLCKCALSLYATIEEVCTLTSHEERVARTISVLNTNETLDLELMEGLKAMMLIELFKLRRRIDDEEDVPIFAHLLFARDSSMTLSDFLKNHLNCVGDTGGLEQVELCLLGQALGIQIRVLRLSQSGQEDFDCLFPDDAPPEWPVVSLIAEDDRHYNVPLP